ncbi:MAG: bifunctional 3-deoxy-7-phosphoheptulonate synthase/chorismate mutase type II, partial [Bacteroidales bacterium]|nr:bifunctional 3-deoxy-7-phosphoheptulonate synthase/chorismate mutase type II [Bacteroidales bacterium]
MSVKLDLKPISLPGLKTERPLVISGPCSAESEEQVMLTAKNLAKHGFQVFRAGIWKPRTRPNSFEGHGSKALPWMKKVKEETGMYTATEVANVKHVFEALKHGIDILWIGARTTANPFAVQEIADALEGVDVPVLVKNPINPDAELWIGALERLNIAGIKQLAAIHRGFSSAEKGIYRNPPQWQIPIELKRRIPDLPMIVDPSHICGSWERLFEISQKAMDLNFDGLIIESHINPEEAWSDAKQQITPDELKSLVEKLVLRKADIADDQKVTLEELRTQIDKFDDEIMSIFEKRMKIADEIGKYKKTNNITILQTKRWDEILTKRISEGNMKGLGAEFITRIFRAIHQ